MLFGDWQPRNVPPWRKARPNELTATSPRVQSDAHRSSVFQRPLRPSRLLSAHGAVGVLSDGLSSRLFTEVREKRGLCYSVHAVCHSVKNRGCVLCYAGTTTERAQETLNVVLDQLEGPVGGCASGGGRAPESPAQERLIMQQESSSARSSSLAADWYYLAHIQTLDDVRRIVDGLTCDSINRYLAAHPPTDFLVVTLGQKPLEIPL